jgi:histidine triad (HIT) family protein
LRGCVFCRIASGDAAARIVHDDGEVLAFRDVHPQAPVHVLVIPRRHLASLDEARPEDRGLLGRLLLAAQEVARREGIGGAYRIVNNCGPSAGQSVFHVHLHLLGGRAMGWPPG